MFQNRFDAGEQLAHRLEKYKNQKNTYIKAIPNGGVICGHVISTFLGLPLEIEYINKILHPDDPKLVVGYVNYETVFIENEHDLLKTYIDVEVERLKAIQFQSRKIFFADEKWIDPKGKSVILVDDGIETGATMKLSIEMAKRSGADRIIIATPVGSRKIIEDLKNHVDELVFLECCDNFGSLNDHYQQFSPVKDSTLIKLLHADNES